jgi:hypothetical protein
MKLLNEGTNQFRVIEINTTNDNFNKRFDNLSKFWKALKNGGTTIGKITNRDFFRGISGMYLSLETENDIQILIIYYGSLKELNELQLTLRLKKILGLEISIHYGCFLDYEERIYKMFDSIKRNTHAQLFGEYYNKTKNL